MRVAPTFAVPSFASQSPSTPVALSPAVPAYSNTQREGGIQLPAFLSHEEIRTLCERVTNYLGVICNTPNFEQFNLNGEPLFSSYGPGMYTINLGQWGHEQLQHLFEYFLRGLDGHQFEHEKEYVQLVPGRFVANRYVNPNH